MTRDKARVVTRRLTKASVLRALQRCGACPRALRWFRRQSSLKVAWTTLSKQGPTSSHPHVRCWVQVELGLHGATRTIAQLGGRRGCSARVASYREVYAAAIQKGWNR